MLKCQANETVVFLTITTQHRSSAITILSEIYSSSIIEAESQALTIFLNFPKALPQINHCSTIATKAGFQCHALLAQTSDLSWPTGRCTSCRIDHTMTWHRSILGQAHHPPYQTRMMRPASQSGHPAVSQHFAWGNLTNDRAYIMEKLNNIHG